MHSSDILCNSYTSDEIPILTPGKSVARLAETECSNETCAASRRCGVMLSNEACTQGESLRCYLRAGQFCFVAVWTMAHTHIARQSRGHVTLCLKLTKRLGLERVEVSAEQGLGGD